MNEVTLHLDGKNHPVDIHVDGTVTPINAFLLLTSVPGDMMHNIAFGNSDTVGRMLFAFWKNCVLRDEQTAMILEMVAKDIISEATRLRPPWPGDETVGTA